MPKLQTTVTARSSRRDRCARGVRRARLDDVGDQRIAFRAVELPQLLGVSRREISRLISSGRLRSKRVGHRTVLVSRTAILEFLQG